MFFLLKSERNKVIENKRAHKKTNMKVDIHK